MLADFLAMQEVEDRPTFIAALVSHAQRLGFKTVGAIVVHDRLASGPKFFAVDNAPPEYRHIYDDPQVAKECPVSQHCKRTNVPIAWDQETFVSVGKAETWERHAAFGYRAGIAWALHMPHGVHYLIGVDRDQPLPLSPADLARAVADFQLLAVHSVDAALRVLGPTRRQEDIAIISRRERECLSWTMEGKTAWEVGKILRISEQTAIRHLNNAMQKLDCVSKHQAVLKALRLGLIQ